MIKVSQSSRSSFCFCVGTKNKQWYLNQQIMKQRSLKAILDIIWHNNFEKEHDQDLPNILFKKILIFRKPYAVISDASTKFCYESFLKNSYR